MIEKYSCYEYEIRKSKQGWDYVIYDPDHKPSKNTIIRESETYFDTAQQARFAAIGHISSLENGEG